MNLTKSLVALASIGAVSLAVGSPVVSDVRMNQPVGSHKVTITYKLSEPAVVTLDVLTNATPNASTGWTSIGGEAVCTAQGAVWRKVTDADADASGDYTITWRPDLSWKDDEGNCLNVEAGCAKAVVTAWALNNTPNYMVVDISTGAQPNTQRYYPAVDFLPGAEPGQRGAITNNAIYKTTMLVMRKIMAKDVTWTMGAAAIEPLRVDSTRERPHQVTLTNNYYIAVFEMTQAQWALLPTGRSYPSYFNNATYRPYRPVERVCYNEIRMAANSTTAASGAEEWPGRPYSGSFLGLLSSRTGLDFDLPTEAQWEFAARAGHGSPYWANGTVIIDEHDNPNLHPQARFAYNSGCNGTVPARDCDASIGTAWVGSYEPNSWGIYDMAGNVCEWCVDWFTEPLTSSDGTPAASGSSRTFRGGAYGGSDASDTKTYGTARACRPAWRNKTNPSYQGFSIVGFRVVCTAGLE